MINTKASNDPNHLPFEYIPIRSGYPGRGAKERQWGNYGGSLFYCARDGGYVSSMSGPGGA
jgi:hypothetical protein